MKIPTRVAAILAVTFTSAVSADSRTEIDTSTPSVKFQNVSINHDGDRFNIPPPSPYDDGNMALLFLFSYLRIYLQMS